MISIKRYIKGQPLTLLVILGIWIVCLIPMPEMPKLQGIKMIDKWTHFVMYGTLGVVAIIEYARRTKAFNWPRLLFYALVLPIIMSGIIELCQAYLTNGVRSGDWIDFFANCIGAALGFIIASPFAALKCKKHNNK